MNIKHILKEIPITSSYDKWVFITAMLFGVITSYAYLDFIDKLSLFSNITDSFSALVAIAVVYCILAFLTGICFIFALLTAFLIKDTYNNYQLSIRFLVVQFAFLTIGFLPYFLMPFFGLSQYSLWLVLSSFILVFLLNISIIKFSDNQNNNDNFDMAFLIALITVFQHYPIISSIFPIADFSNKSSDEWMLFLLIPSINLLMYLISFLAIAVSPDKNFNIKNIFFVMFGVFFVGYFVLFSIKGKAPYQSLYAVRFIEKPRNSSWYILHNNNSPIATINGMTKQDIERHKQKFVLNDWAKFCRTDDFSKQNIINCEYLYDYTQDINPNALYGYMAWNLGNTKVFCPVSVDFFDDKGDNKEKSAKCLVIDGKYLQPVGEHYLAK
ncbi:hypothetical protein [Moraxella equi]|uniref:Uncharacterized protein n=1 Tax=Moraxella equi TaxID=60442 RepID=A0A378QSV3_9GAMM|nr:hypothetical protein [Moraxella equi]OPH39769.1 hypothetical protein B5J93_02390 [Moraxella equi]STZ03986.1 Uncharacterised protein [Moraxella equi]